MKESGETDSQTKLGSFQQCSHMKAADSPRGGTVRTTARTEWRMCLKQDPAGLMDLLKALIQRGLRGAGESVAL